MSAPRHRALKAALPAGARRQREARLELKLTQAAVAQHLKVSVQAVRLWEAGGTLYGKNLAALSSLLGVSTSALGEGRDRNRFGNAEAREILWAVVEELEELRGRVLEALAKL